MDEEEATSPVSKRGLRICFSSDLHGNLAQYATLADAAKTRKCDILLIGGDLSPHEKKTANSQLAFLVENVIPLLDPLKGICEVYLIFGNTDFRRNVIRLKELFQQKHPHLHMLDGAGEFVFLNKKSNTTTNSTTPQNTTTQNDNATQNAENNNNTPTIASNSSEAPDADSYVLFGYSFVPLSPHKKKDFEKWDTNMDVSEINTITAKRVFGSKGYSSMEDDYIPIVMDLEQDIKNNNTIETDLENLVTSFQQTYPNIPSSKHIWMIHGPPFRTCLDHTGKHGHVGSVAIYEAIKKFQPCASFHGHIHETVNMSNGKYREQIGRANSYSSGNIYGKKLSYLIFDTSSPASAKRYNVTAW